MQKFFQVVIIYEKKGYRSEPSEIISKKGYKNHIARGNLISFYENIDRTQNK